MSKEKIEIHRGKCHCGSVSFRAEGTPVVVAHCHCEDCQRLSGAGHTTGAMFAVKNFKLDGQIAEYTLQANNGNHVTKAFCPNCGSQILGRNTGSSDYVTISLGTFDDSSMLEPEVTIFARNKKPWDIMDDQLPTFETQPDWKPGRDV